MKPQQPSSTSRILANNVISCLQDQPPARPSKEFLQVNARWLMGQKLADALDIGRPPFYFWALMTLQCLTIASITYCYRTFQSLDQRRIKVCSLALVLRQIKLIGPTEITQSLLECDCRKVGVILSWMITCAEADLKSHFSKIGLNQESTFEFKFIPELCKRTAREGPEDVSIRGSEKLDRGSRALSGWAWWIMLLALAFIALSKIAPYNKESSFVNRLSKGS